MSSSGSWILKIPPRSEPRVRLFCFPFAGGTAGAFRSWSEGLPQEVELCPVQLPGRGASFRETPFRSTTDLVPAAAEALRPHLDRPFALFGHSVGSLIAFELARELRRRGWAEPILLAVSGHEAPQLPDPDPPMGGLPEPEFLSEIQRRYGGIPAEVLAEEALLRLLLPVLRADVQVLESYAYSHEPPLECPIACFGGASDRRASPRDLEAWREQTRGAFSLEIFPGGHFFIDTARSALLRSLSACLSPWTGARVRVHA